MNILPSTWASPEDFATLFQYNWYTSFPLDPKSPGAKRVDWTIHIGIVVRNIGDLMGLRTRFECGGRSDAVYRSMAGDEVALEWEWQGIEGQNELKKLKAYTPWGRPEHNHTKLKYAVLITYVDKDSLEDNLADVSCSWKGADWPLLLIAVVSQKSRNLSSHKEFNKLMMYLFDENGDKKLLKDVPASPWEVDCTCWQWQIS